MAGGIDSLINHKGVSPIYFITVTFADVFADNAFREDKRVASHKAARRDTGYI
jgi:hypothetical protein